MKSKVNEFVRIAFLIIVISIIGIGYTLFWAFEHNGESTYVYGLGEVLSMTPCLTFLQILALTLLSLSLVGSIMYLIYSHGGKVPLEKLYQETEKLVVFCVETILLTILIVLLIIIPTNIMLEHQYETSSTSTSTHHTPYNNGPNNSI